MVKHIISLIILSSLVVSCSFGGNKRVESQRIFDTGWKLEYLRGTSRALIELMRNDASAELHIIDDSIFNALSPCGKMDGTYTLETEGQYLYFTVVDQTPRACHYSMFDANYMQALAASTNYKIEDDSLRIYDFKEDLVLVFSRYTK